MKKEKNKYEISYQYSKDGYTWGNHSMRITANSDFEAEIQVKNRYPGQIVKIKSIKKI